MKNSRITFLAIIFFLPFLSCSTNNGRIQDRQKFRVTEIIPNISEKFRGAWDGATGFMKLDNITAESGDILNGVIKDILIYVYPQNITEYVFDFDENIELPYREIKPEKEYFLNAGNHLVYTWLNKGGIWSETQVLCFSMINENKLLAAWNRHVNNDTENDNDVWNIQKEIIFDRHDIDEEYSIIRELTDKNKKQVNSNGFAEKKEADARFSGNWNGVIKLNDGSSIYIQLRIAGNEAAISTGNKDKYYNIRPRVYHYDFLGNNFVYTSININNRITYSEIFSFSIINNSTLNVLFLRNNNIEISKNENRAWIVFGQGELTK
jgi:hypothetical protein